MKIYSTGILSFLATVVALLANTQLRQNFDMEYPILFISGQVLCWSCFLVLPILNGIYFVQLSYVYVSIVSPILN